MATRDFTQYIVDPTEKGPEAVFGPRTVVFKKNQPLSAVVALFAEDEVLSPLDRSKNYLRVAAIQTEPNLAALEGVFDDLEATGLTQIVEWLTSEYAAFPIKKSDGS